MKISKSILLGMLLLVSQLTGCVGEESTEEPTIIEEVSGEELIEEASEGAHIDTSSKELIAFWGRACTKRSYGWGRVAGSDLDFYVDFDCPTNRQYRSYTSLALAGALAATGKRLLTQRRWTRNGVHRDRIILGGSAVRRVFNNGVGNWFLSTQVERRYR